MALAPRKEVIDESASGIDQCVNRCVRWAFLCGEDAVSGRDFDHRKGWVRERVELLAGVFGIEVLSFAVTSNNLYFVLRNRPDVVTVWQARRRRSVGGRSFRNAGTRTPRRRNRPRPI